MKKRGKFVINLSKTILRKLQPYVKKIEVAGSIRREKPNPRDIDIVLIPKNREKISEVMNSLGKFMEVSEKKQTYRIKKISVELYFTSEESWGATLLAFSSKRGSAIGLRIIARFKGFKLNQYGLFKKGKMMAGRTEKDIYRALGRKYKDPKDR